MPRQAEPRAFRKPEFASMSERNPVTGEYLCKVCGKSFGIINSFQQHLNRHLYVFNCSYCTRTFNAKDDRKAHETLYHCPHAEMPVCDKCEQTWSRQLWRHREYCPVYEIDGEKHAKPGWYRSAKEKKWLRIATSSGGGADQPPEQQFVPYRPLHPVSESRSARPNLLSSDVPQSSLQSGSEIGLPEFNSTSVPTHQPFRSLLPHTSDQTLQNPPRHPRAQTSRSRPVHLSHEARNAQRRTTLHDRQEKRQAQMIHVANGGSHSFESATNHPSRPAPPAWGIVAPSSPHEPTYYSSFHPGINSVHPPPSTHSFGSYPYSHHTASTVFSSPDPSHSHSSFLPQSDQPSIVGGGGLPWSIENQHWSDQHGSNQLEIPQTFGSVNSFVPSTPSLHTSSAYEYPDLQAHPTLTNPYDFDPSLFLF